MEKDKVVVNIQTLGGEVPETYVSAAKFGDFSNVSANGLLGDQMILVGRLVEVIAKDGMRFNEEGIPFFVAAILSTLTEAVGEENMRSGEKLMKSKQAKKEVNYEAVLDALLKALGE